jgi:hypothetical protein
MPGNLEAETWKAALILAVLSVGRRAAQTPADVDFKRDIQPLLRHEPVAENRGVPIPSIVHQASTW